jgi:hypothetical protein
MSQDSAVGIATGYVLDDLGVRVRVPVGSRIFSSPNRPDRLWGPPNLLSNGYRGVTRPGREANHSPPASAEVKEMWIYTSTPPIRLYGVVLNSLNTGTTFSISTFMKIMTVGGIEATVGSSNYQQANTCSDLSSHCVTII